MIMDKKLIVLNGPPRCGKDTLARYLAHEENLAHIKFASKLKIMAHCLYGIPNPEDIYQFEDCKDEPNPAFYGLTPRQAYIEVSERYIKPVHGMSFFGDRLLETIEGLPNKIFVASDGGLIEELSPVANGLGTGNVLVIKISRPTCNFIEDSRSYYPDFTLNEMGMLVLNIYNNWDLSLFLQTGTLLVKEWMDGGFA